MNLYQSVMDRLNADKKNFRFMFYNPESNKLFFVKSRWRLMPQKRFYYDYYDGELFGKHIAESRTTSWQYIGDIGV